MAKYALSDDGKVIDGRIIVFLKPPQYRDGPASDEDRRRTTSAEESSPAERPDNVASKTQPALKDPRWARSEIEHGEIAAMEVAVEHGEGRRVRFIVERKDGPRWEQVATVEAAVAKGKARGEVKLEHSAHKSGNVFDAAADHELRF